MPGVNVDKLDLDAGMDEARAIGGFSHEDMMVIEYALMRWQRGEEDGAERTITSHKVDYTCWRRILAAAVAAAQ